MNQKVVKCLALIFACVTVSSFCAACDTVAFNSGESSQSSVEGGSSASEEDGLVEDSSSVSEDDSTEDNLEEPTLIGMQITSTQWDMAMNTLDWSRVVGDEITRMYTENGELYSEKIGHSCINGNKGYSYYSQKEWKSNEDTGRGEWEYREQDRWITEIDGTSYVYESELVFDGGSGNITSVYKWRPTSHVSNFSSFQYGFSQLETYLDMGFSSFIWDEERMAYVMEVVAETATGEIGLRFIDGKLLSYFVVSKPSNIAENLPYSELVGELNCVFMEEEIVLPSQEELNELIKNESK